MELSEQQHEPINVIIEEYEQLLIAIDEYLVKDNSLSQEWLNTDDQQALLDIRQQRDALSITMQPTYRRKKIIEVFGIAVFSNKETE